ncbi:MAG: hypothetical protein JWN67_1626 [Actinomycetia bacterium]|nr:hypothetical protein [Actinomycetes bacterium]
MGGHHMRMGARITAVVGVSALVLGVTGIASAAPTAVSAPLTPPPPATLSGPGWTVQEHTVSGTATAYERVGSWGIDGAWEAKPSTTAGYTTRVVVRRPTDPARFNGTVVVEWLNVSAGFDNSPTLVQARPELLRGGYAWVGVSAQHLGVDGPAGLKANDPKRYAALSHPGDSYSYDIFSQVGQDLRAGSSLLGGLTVKRLLAAGQSQSASRMGTYINAVQPLAKVYDGFLVQDRTANLAPLFDKDAGVPPAAHIRTDGAGPVLEVQNEGDIVALRSHTARQDDTDRFRLWEVAGGAHADEYTLSPQVPSIATVAGSPCTSRANSAAYHVVVSAAVDALDRWAGGGAVPPTAPRIEIADPTAADPVARDAHGNAKGGIRLPQLEVPIATIDGQVNTPPPGAGAVFVSFCRLFGRTTPFSEAKLRALYPTHATYVAAVAAAADRLVAAGFARPADAADLKAEAVATDVGKRGNVVAWNDGFASGIGESTAPAGGHPAPLGVAGVAPTVTDAGFWVAGRDGGVFSYGDATFLGSLGGRRLNQPIVGIAATPSGRGYWLAAMDGGVFAFGDARYLGGLVGKFSRSPVNAIAANPWGQGYWLVREDGSVTGFGDSKVAAGTTTFDVTVVDIAPTPTGAGYWLLTATGRVGAFGDAVARGNGPTHSSGIVSSASGQGYRILATDGSVTARGDAVPLSGPPRRGQSAVALG